MHNISSQGNLLLLIYLELERILYTLCRMTEAVCDGIPARVQDPYNVPSHPDVPQNITNRHTEQLLVDAENLRKEEKE